MAGISILRELAVKISYLVDKASLIDVEKVTDRVKGSLDNAAKTAETFGKRLTEAAKRAKPALDRAAGAIRNLDGRANAGAKRIAQVGIAAGVGLVGGAVAATAQAETLNARLITATGSAAAAADTMERLTAFTATNTLTTAEAADAFIKLKNLGLNPSEESIRSFANTAIAMGKDLDQFVEAVADATTGEFERLKEFGIKASKDGDKVALTFRGTTTKMKMDARTIQSFLMDLGDENFGDAMASQVDTLSVQFKKARERSAVFLSTIGEAGLAGGIRRLLDRMTELSQGSGSLAERIGVALGNAIDLLIKGIDLAAENTDTLKTILLALGGAFAGLKVLRIAGAFGAFASGVIETVKALQIASVFLRGAAVASAPLLLKIVAVTAAIVALVEAFRFLTGQGGVVQDFVERFAEADGVLGDIARALIDLRAQLAPVIEDIFQTITTQAGEMAAEVIPALMEIAEAFIAAAKVIAPLLIDWVKRFITVQTTIARVAIPVVSFLVKLAAFMFKAQLRAVAFFGKFVPGLLKLSNAFRKFFVPVEQGIKGLVMLFDLLGAAIDKASAFFSSLFEDVASTVGRVLEPIRAAFDQFLEGAREAIRFASRFVDLPKNVLDFAFGPDEQKAKGEAERGRLETGRGQARAAAEELLRIREQRAALTANVNNVNITLQGTVSDTSQLVAAAGKAGEEFGKGTLAQEFRNLQPAEQ